MLSSVSKQGDKSEGEQQWRRRKFELYFMRWLQFLGVPFSHPIANDAGFTVSVQTACRYVARTVILRGSEGNVAEFKISNKILLLLYSRSTEIHIGRSYKFPRIHLFLINRHLESE